MTFFNFGTFGTNTDMHAHTCTRTHSYTHRHTHAKHIGMHTGVHACQGEVPAVLYALRSGCWDSPKVAVPVSSIYWMKMSAQPPGGP
jgi:hypothetical protein